MSVTVQVNERGSLTLPKELREKYGLEKGGQVVIQETEEGLLLQVGATFPVEIYSEKRIEEFQKNNEEALGDFDLGR